ncbi:hypothetical protein K461DRAFT_323454 [Myriangium duriaei CBS 260.36]|uniref:Cysteine dioxygenase n=1 Tax=Myriangium duriaei CBS 260.36 TaxID=1168546 RepID=A0A9P4ITZ1_9PEZI|nr:hypothetical protein K461DRAFT_323454 [Myriangium duriaei CBS 260.36]
MATPAQFFDPFFEPASLTPPSSDHKAGFRVPVSVPVNKRKGVGHSGDNEDNIQPIGSTDNAELPITGQGTIAALTSAEHLLRFTVATKDRKDGDAALHLDIGPGDINLYFNPPGKTDVIPLKPNFTKGPTKGKEACYLNNAAQGFTGPTTYWLSVDKNMGFLRYGKYFTNKSMTLMDIQLKHFERKEGSPDDGTWVWDEANLYSWMEDVKSVSVQDDDKDPKTSSLRLKIQPLPIMMDFSPFVVSSDKVTLIDLETGKLTTPANLPNACQILYGNVAGTEIVLDDPDFPDFSKAIQRSCITPGLWGYNKLEEKKNAGELGHDILGTYLRITLGYNLGNSPGVPYVVEIWPSKHHSPIHDHGKACAVIKVLHGQIQCTWYDNLGTSSVQPAELGPPGILQEGQITWIGPNNYQIHKLENVSDTVCVTVQCYKYIKSDREHEDVFNWRDDKGQTQKFNPNSDASFTEFRRIMKKEWYIYMGERAQRGEL